MVREENNEICTLGGDMLAYLYDEMPASARDGFDLHLADCQTCIDSFAELSQSRYSVYEWKKLDFDPLATPHITIPYDAVIVSGNAGSFLDRVREGIRRFGWATAVPAFGALVLAGVFGFIYVGSSESTIDFVAENEAATSPTPRVPARTIAPVSPVNESIDPVVSERPDTVKDEKIVPVRASDRKAVPRKPSPTPLKANQPTRASMPTLADHDDDEDDSLRLADLFDEIDTSR